MRRRNSWRAELRAAAAAALACLAALAPAEAADRKQVVTTIAQISEPLAVIAAGNVDVVPLMGEGVDPHLYRLTRSDVARLSRADLILYNGLDLEAQMIDMLRRFARQKPVVAIAEAVPKDRLLGLAGKAHDPHVWMDPALWRLALASAVDALADLDPANAMSYRRNAAAYFARLADLDRAARAAVATIPAAARALVTAHDAFGYFGRSYNIDVLAIQGISTESEAGIRKIEELVDTLVTRRIAAVFVETSVSARNVRALIEGAAARGHTAKIGGLLFSDAMGTKGTYTGTYLGMFDHNVTTIVRALGGKAPARGLDGRLAPGTE